MKAYAVGPESAEQLTLFGASSAKSPARCALSIDPDTSTAPAGWTWRRLAPELARLESGHTPSRRRPEWWGGDVPWIALPDIRALDGKVAYETHERTNEQGLANSSARLLPAGTVVLSRTASVGFVTLMGRPMATSQDFVCWVCGPELDPSFLAYLLRSARRYIRSLADGAIHKTVYYPTVEKFHVCVPALAEQQRIASILRTQLAGQERALAQAESALAAAAALPDAYLRQAFRGVPLAVEDRSEGAPSGWRWLPLSALARLESGHTPSRRHPEWWGGDVPWIALPDIRGLDGRVAHETRETINQGGLDNSSARLLPAGTVVLSRTAMVGHVTIMGRPMATSQDFVNFVCGPDLEPRFLAFIFRAARDYLRSIASGASITNKTIYFPTAQAFRVCIPSIAEQRRIADDLTAKLARVDALRRSLEDQSAALRDLPAALLRRAFNGEL